MNNYKGLKVLACTTMLTVGVFSINALACTGMYVGKDVSTDGTTIIGRSEDQGGGAYNKTFHVQPAVTKANRYLTDEGTGFTVPLPKTTYKYTYVSDSSDANDGQYFATCTNEYGLAVVGTVSTGTSEEYEALDPTTEYDNGLREAILPGLIACQAKTAREAAELCAELHTEYGAAEWNTLFFTDQEEAWIFENYGGHTYCAMKMPTDQVAVFGNQIMIGWVDPDDTTGDYIYSDNLFETVDKLENPVKEDGKYHLALSIDPGPRSEYSNMRTWEGLRVLAGDEAAGEYSDDTFYPLFYAPAEKVSVLQIMDLFRDRYAGTDYDMSQDENEARRPIGITRSSDVHIIQTYSDLPAETCHVQWLCMGNAENSVFIPAFSGITDTHDAYQVDGSAYQDDSAWWMFKRIATLAQADRAFLSTGVQDFWNDQEEAMYDQIQDELAKVQKAYKRSKTAGQKYVTKLSKEMTQTQLDNADLLFQTLMYTATNNDNDRAGNARKATFVKPVEMIAAAKDAGYTVKVNGNKYQLTKDGVTYTLIRNSKGVHVDGAYADDMMYPIVKFNGVVYAPADFLETLAEL